MKKITKIARCFLAASIVAGMMTAGCTKHPDEEQLAKLKEQRQAAEAAEKKLAELREERMQLEEQLDQKESELTEHERERDDLKEKMDEREGEDSTTE